MGHAGVFSMTSSMDVFVQQSLVVSHSVRDQVRVDLFQSGFDGYRFSLFPKV